MTILSIGAISTLIFSIILAITYYLAKRNEIILVSSLNTSKKTVNLDWFSIFLISGISGLYSIYTTLFNKTNGGDRVSYLYEFNGNRENEMFGFELFMDIFRMFSDSFTLFLTLICFICVFIALVAYRNYKEATPFSLLLLFSTQYILFTFYLLKQCFANALATLFFALLFSTTGKKRIISCLITIIIACQFHATSIVLLPIMIICCSKGKKHVAIYSGLFAGIMLFFDKIALAIADLAMGIYPMLSLKIINYFGNYSENSGADFITLLKGAPIYIVLVLALLYRDKLREKIEFYDSYLIITIVASLVYVFGLWSYWMIRIVYLLYFPVFVYFSQITNNIENKNTGLMLKLMVFSSTLFFSVRELIMLYSLHGGF